jgi:putative membrane protein
MGCACAMGVSAWWMMLIPALFFAAVIIGGIVLVRRLWGGSSLASDSPSSALHILEERFARGEIDRDEFNERREHLRL